MKNFHIHISSLIIVALVFMSSCQHKPNTTIAQALLLAGEHPDSALALLNNMQFSELGKSEQAKYAVVYTMAQDKSGLDVDEDSLLRIGYNWYEKHPEDSLYAKCQYYMGKYYMLNDSTEFAIRCLYRSYKASEMIDDILTECLALETLSKVEKMTDAEQALLHARMAIDKCERDTRTSLANKIYFRLNLCEALEFADSSAIALKECKTALSLAEELGDSLVFADTYQDMSRFFHDVGMYQKALTCAKEAYLYRKSMFDTSNALALADAYCDVDSTLQAKEILAYVSKDSHASRHLIYYIRCKAAIREGKIQPAIVCLDSSNYYLDKMYCTTMQVKNDYYVSVLQKEKEEARLQGEITSQKAATVLTVVLALIVIIFVLYIYNTNKKQAKQKAAMAVQLHAQELSHRDIQICTMRNFLLKKIDIMEKIESMRNEKEKHILISEDDWNEIEVFLDSVENLFVSRLRAQFSGLTKKDLRLMMLLRLKMPQKALALIYGISEKAIKQKLFLYKAKVGIEKEQKSLREFMENY